MEIKDLLKEIDVIKEEIQRKELVIKLMSDKVIALAREDINRSSKIQADVIKDEKTFKSICKNMELENLEYRKNYSMNKVQIQFDYKNDTWHINIPFDLECNEVCNDIIYGFYNKISLHIRNKTYSCSWDFVERFDDIFKCVEYIKKYKEKQNEKKSKTN